MMRIKCRFSRSREDSDGRKEIGRPIFEIRRGSRGSLSIAAAAWQGVAFQDLN